MAGTFTTRHLSQGDFPALASILDETGLFPSALLDDMAAPFLRGDDASLWVVVSRGDAVVGFAFVEPERMTDGTYNLLAMAVSPAEQSGGAGTALVAAIERQLADAGGRVLLVETSSLPDYADTRAFYEKRGFAREAMIRDFYISGEDKIIFWKRLQRATVNS